MEDRRIFHPHRFERQLSSFLRDALGSTVGLVGSAGTIATSYTYQPFGATTVSGAANSNVYQFTGRENDGTPGGLYYYRARYYSPSYQRFAAQDPIDFARRITNLYAYARNNPIRYRDASGRIEGDGDETECYAAGVCGALDQAVTSPQ
jgi:RHS repeat-associated protein